MTPGKTTALTRWTFVGKVMSLLFNMLSMLVITFRHRYTYFPSLLKLPSTSHPDIEPDGLCLNLLSFQNLIKWKLEGLMFIYSYVYFRKLNASHISHDVVLDICKESWSGDPVCSYIA